MPAKARKRRAVAEKTFSLGLSSHAVIEFRKKIIERMHEKNIMWAEAEKEIIGEMKKRQK